MDPQLFGYAPDLEGAAPALRDAANRGIVAGLLGAPADLGNGLLNAGKEVAGVVGNKIGLLSADQMPQPVSDPFLGSEWWGQKMQDAGLVSPDRRPLAELLAGAAVPDGGLLAAMSPEGKARLLAALQAGAPSGRFRLGDVTQGQAKGLDALFGRPSAATDVYMTDDGVRHLLAGRIGQDGYTPEQVTQFAQQAMAKRSSPDLNVAKGGQAPGLLSAGLVDLASGRPYSARMPLKQVDDGLEVRTVVPEGLAARNNKAP